jgi:hypothetical protein
MKPQSVGRFWVSLLYGNLALALLTGEVDFFPSHTALWIALAYAVACTCLHFWASGYLRRSAETQVSFGVAQVSDFFNMTLRGRLLLALIFFGFSFLAMARGVSGLGTWLFGFDSDVPYTATRVHWANRKFHDCYHYKFKEQNAYTEMFNSVCLDDHYQRGSRFRFIGQTSFLGMHYDSFVVEVPEKPAD